MDYRQCYDSKYSKGVQGFSPAFPRQMRFLLRWMDVPVERRRVLDLGGGTGEYSLMLQRMGYDVTLYEISQVAIDHARSMGVAKTVYADFFVEPPTERFDIVLVKGFSPLNTDSRPLFDESLGAVEAMLAPQGVVLYWGVTDLSGQWSDSGWFNWPVANLRLFFDDVLIFPALRYQSVLPVWCNRRLSNALSRCSVLPRPLTLVAYKRVGDKSKA
jgi:SAM-dependent methyltransferase